MNITRLHSNRKGYNWLLYDIEDKFLKKFVPCYKGTLYDLGCGEAPYKDFFLEHADKYVGIDWSASLHSVKADLISNLNEPLPVESNTADTIVSISVLEHLTKPQTMLNEAYRILKPGGYFILHSPWQWHIHEQPHDYFRYSFYGLRYMFEEAGFKNIEIEPQSGFFTMLALKLNYFSLRLIRGPEPIKTLIRIPISIFWYLSQVLALSLDKIDKNWSAETSGYYVLAQKE